MRASRALDGIRPAFRLPPLTLWALGALAVLVGLLAVAALSRTERAPAEAELAVAVGPQITVREAIPLLTRYGETASGVEIDLMYAAPIYFEIAAAEQPAEALSQPTAVFVLQEGVHDEDDMPALTSVFLVGDSGERVAPYTTKLVVDGPHHRTTRLLFSAPASLAAALETGARPSALTLVIPGVDGRVDAVDGTFTWGLPLLLDGAGASASVDDAALPDFVLADVAKSLQRTKNKVEFQGVSDIEVRATYATREYFDLALPASIAARFEPDFAITFMLSESTHETPLPSDVLAVSLQTAGETFFPDLVEQRITSEHHRVTMVRFPVGPLIAEQSGTMALLLPDGGSLEWTLPIDYTAIGAVSPFGITWGTILAMLAGLLAAMWPCLFQLTAFFIPTLAGVTTEDANGRVTFGGRLRVMKAAMYFVLGFTIVYTLAGALIGLLAGRLADASDFERFQRYLAMGGGFIILILAVRVAAKARAPLVCKMPVLSGMAHKKAGSSSSPWELMFAGLAFATGCMTCFGAAMVLTMVIYVGLNGSMFFGASVMFLFSLGMGIPLVIAAVAMAQVLPLLFRLEKLVPWMGLTSGILMIGFALLLITGNYMLLTEWVYKVVGGPAIG